MAMVIRTPRDAVRARRNEVYNRAKEVGVDLRHERDRYGTNERALSSAAKKRVNEGAPRQDAEVLTIDAPPDGVMDGLNTTFTLSGVVAGHQIGVVWGDTSVPRTVNLVKSTENPPPGDAFFFDFNVPDTIIVGSPPTANDTLVVSYKSRLKE